MSAAADAEILRLRKLREHYRVKGEDVKRHLLSSLDWMQITEYLEGHSFVVQYEAEVRRCDRAIEEIFKSASIQFKKDRDGQSNLIHCNFVEDESQ